MNEIRPEMAQHPLAQAARETNSYAETHGLEETIERYDLTMADVRYMAEQRALRALWAFRGLNLNLREPTILELKPQDMPMYIKLTSAYMDGLLIGWVAREKQMKNDEDDNKTKSKTV